MRIAREYALYKGDELIDIGTVKELAKKFNVKEDTIRVYKKPRYAKSDKRRILIKIEDDEDEN